MATWTVELPDDLRAFAEQQAAAGGHASPQAFVADVLNKARRRAERRAHVEQLLLDGLNSGEPIIADEAYWEALHRDIEEQIRRDAS